MGAGSPERVDHHWLQRRGCHGEGKLPTLNASRVLTLTTCRFLADHHERTDRDPGRERRRKDSATIVRVPKLECRQRVARRNSADPPLRVCRSVDYISFSAHVDYTQNSQFIDEVSQVTLCFFSLEMDG